jgi:glycosyltransferase involved in cell wall biosynthesis
MTSSPRISVVIPTYNRERLLTESLESFRHLAPPAGDFEVIVVDDGSRDGTPAALERWAAAAGFHPVCLQQTHAGPAAARNRGVQVARGEFVAFTDDDCSVDSAWLNELLAGFTTGSVGAVGGTVRSQGGSRMLVRYQDQRQTFAADLSGQKVPPFVITGNACFRREAVLKAGGFDENLRQPGGEDPDLSWRVAACGYELRFNPAAIVYHRHEARLGDFVRSSYQYGRGFHYIAAKHDLPRVQRVNWRARARMLSPYYFAYRARRYRRDQRRDWGTALAFAFLDHLRELAWERGYWSWRESS